MSKSSAPGDLHVHIPASIADALDLSEESAEQVLRRELALTLYAQEKLSFGKARELAGMSTYAFGQLLGERQIPRHYGQEELEEDLRYARGE